MDLRGVSENKEKNEKIYLKEQPCQSCKGSRLNNKVLSSRINNKNIGEFSNMQLDKSNCEIKKI